MIKNIISLFLVQGAGYLLPLITLPYLVRVLGPSQYGVLGFSLAFSQYFTLIVQYGFDLSATNKIAINKDDKKIVSQVFWGVLFCRIVLLVVGAIVMLLIINFVPQVNAYGTVIAVSYTSVIGAALVPSWLFQGKEKMGWMAISNISAKIITIPLIFIFVHTPHDTWIVSLLTGLGFVLGAFVCFFFVYREGWVQLSFPDNKLLKELIEDGRYIFLSNIAGSVYVNSIPIFLGFSSGPVTVGIYVAADKIRMALQGLMGPFTQVFYPRISSLISTDKEKGLALIRNLLFKQNAIVLLISALLIFYSKNIVFVLYGNTYLPSVSVLCLLSPMLFFISVSTVLGVQGMLVLGMKKQFSQILWFGALLNTAIIFPLIWFSGANGAAISVLVTEALVAFFIVMKTKFIWSPEKNV